MLDALWLAAGPWTLDLDDAPAAADRPWPDIVLPVLGPELAPASEGRTTERPVRGDARPPGETEQQARENAPANREGFAAIRAKADEESVPASSVSLPTAQALAHRLPLTRALRPFRQPFLSTRATELDEEATADLTAELRLAGLPGIYPVERPERERWFEVHLVLEDDPAAALWDAPMDEFVRVLQQSGAFRLVRSWRLRLEAADPLDIARAELLPLHRSPHARDGSDRRLAGQIGADRRQLILFASHGASPHWLDGSYARLLLGWVNAALALLDLLPADRHAQTAIGEPHGIGWAPQAGAPAAAFQSETLWWRTDADAEAPGVLKLPMTTLDPATFANWALSQMARGRKSALYLLDSTQPTLSTAVAADELTPIDVERRLALLRDQSERAHELAIALSIGPFTLPVARVVQEVLFDSATDTTLLADLMLSGVVTMEPPDPATPDEAPTFRVTDHARVLLRQALRIEDRERLFGELQERIGAHLGKRAPGGFSFSVMFRDPAGAARLGAHVQAFMRFAAPVAGSLEPPIAPRPERDLPEFVAGLDDRRRGDLRRLLTRGVALSEETVPPELWRWLLAERLIRMDADRGWIFERAILPALGDVDVLAGLRLLWVDDRAGNNRVESRALRQRGVLIEQAASTREAMAQSDLDSFDVIVSDMTRSDREAGLDLIARLCDRAVTRPVIIYAVVFAQTARNRQRVVDAGGFGCTNDADELMRLIELAALETVKRSGSTVTAPASTLAAVRRGLLAQIDARFGLARPDPLTADPLAAERRRLVSLIKKRGTYRITTEPAPQPTRVHMIADPTLSPDIVTAIEAVLQFTILAADQAERNQTPAPPKLSGAPGGWQDLFDEIVRNLGWTQAISRTFEGYSSDDTAYQGFIQALRSGEEVADAEPAARFVVEHWETGDTNTQRAFIDVSSLTEFAEEDGRLQIAVVRSARHDLQEIELSLLTIFKTRLERRSVLFLKFAPRLSVRSQMTTFATSPGQLLALLPLIRQRLAGRDDLPVIRDVQRRSAPDSRSTRPTGVMRQ